MGFAAGFGESFSRSFEAQRGREAERENDLFRARFSTLSEIAKEKRTRDAEDGKIVQQAKFLTQRYKQPPEVAAWVYNQLKAGTDEKLLQEQLQYGKFNVKSNSAEEQPPEVTQEPADEQMGDMGIGQSQAAPAAPAAPATPQTASATGMDGGGFLSQIFPGMKKFEHKGRDARVDDRLTQALGQSPADLEGPSAPAFQDDSSIEYTPGEAPPDAPSSGAEANIALKAAQAKVLQNPKDEAAKSELNIAQRNFNAIMEYDIIKGDIDAMAQGQDPISDRMGLVKIIDPETNQITFASGRYANGMWETLDGKPLDGATVLSKEEKEDLKGVADKIGPVAEKVITKQNNWRSAMRAGASMAGAVERTGGDVLQGFTAGTAQFVQDLTSEAAAAWDVVVGTENATIGDAEVAATLEKQVSALEQLNAKFVGSPAGKLAHERALFEAQKNLLAYHYGMMMGQEGRALAESERELFSKLAESGTNPAQFYEVMASVMLNQAKNIDGEAATIRDHPAVTTYKVMHEGAIPPIFDPQNVEDSVAKDPAIVDFLARLAPYAGTASGEDITPRGSTPPAEGPAAPPPDQAAVPPGLPEGTVSAGQTEDGRPQYKLPDGRIIAPKAQ